MNLNLKNSIVKIVWWNAQVANAAKFTKRSITEIIRFDICSDRKFNSSFWIVCMHNYEFNSKWFYLELRTT